MADKEHLKILKQGVEVWNRWREENPDIRPDLFEVNLTGANLRFADLKIADLIGANLIGANLIGANLTGANLGQVDLAVADLREANLAVADLREANLREAYLRRAHLAMANLRGANLRGANLYQTNLTGANLRGANLREAITWDTLFADVDLSVVKGLETINHAGPSTIGIDTIYNSQGKIPEAFLRGCGVQDNFITYMRSLTGNAFEFYSCFISHSHKDEDFAQRLFNDLQGEGVRCWFAPHDIRGGEKLYDQIDQAIRLHDKLLLILSDNSIHSEYVMTEIRRARKAEIRDGRRKLFPVSLTDWQTIKDWECFDADTGKDLAVEVREYFVPDFSNWKEHDSYQQAFDRLLRDLKAEG